MGSRLRAAAGDSRRADTRGSIAGMRTATRLPNGALAFLLLIGTTLIAEGFGAHVSKGYIYAAMTFSAGVEALNMLSRRARRHRERSYAT